MNELPNNWATARLGDLAEDISYGYTAPSTRERIGPHLLRITDIQDNDVLWNSVPYCEIDAELANKYLLKENDLLFARTGATVGKSFLIKGEIPDAVFASYLIRVRCMRPEAAGYLSLYFRSQDYWRQITEFSAGIGQPNVNGSKLKELIVPLPPLAEQTRIAAKLDELLAQVDTLQARIDGIPALLKRFRQSVLAAAVSGRLTEEWRVQNCPTPPKAPSPNKYSLSMEELKTFADLHNLPHRWECASAAQICSSVRDGTHDTPAYHLSGIPLVTSKNIGSGFVDTTEAKLISIEDHLEISKRSLVEHGDVLFSMIGTVGNCCVVREQDSEFSIKNVGLFKKNESVILPRFLEFWLNSQVMWSWLEKNLKGSSQKFASLGTLRALPVFLPSLQEQTEIVRRVEQLFAFADQLEAKVASAKSRIDHLTQSILAKAFRGELVPQDPNDEPASVLLARIKAQRAAAPRAKRGRRAATPS